MILLRCLALLFLLRETLTASNKHNDGLVIPLYNRVGYIGVAVELGTPPQSTELLLDTGSSVSWVVSKNNPFCKHNSEIPMKPSFDCERYGTFDMNDSITFNKTETVQNFGVTYYDNTTVTGRYGHDRLSLPNMRDDSEIFRLDGYEFGIGEITNSSTGILGLSVPSFRYEKKGSKKRVHYDKKHIITELQHNGVIQRALFSIWLDGLSNRGELTVGSIDESKFEGPLVTTKFINYRKPGMPAERFEIGVSGMYLNLTGEDEAEDAYYDLFEKSVMYEDQFISALVDTGSVNTHLPVAIFDALLTSIRDKYHVYGTHKGYPIVPCFDEVEELEDDEQDYENKSVSHENFLSFRLNSAIIRVPLRSFLKRRPGDASRVLLTGKTPERCMLGILPQYNNVTILGQGFFRSIYTVFDLDRMELSVAPSVYTSKRMLREITLSDDLNGVDDGVIDPSLAPELYDPSTEFVIDTRDGFYKSVASGSSIIKACSNSLAKALLGLTVLILLA